MYSLFEGISNVAAPGRFALEGAAKWSGILCVGASIGSDAKGSDYYTTGLG